jgi:type 2 lantibiotic biosynthesis protein LanM
MAVAASTIAERLQSYAPPEDGQIHDTRLSAPLEAWCQISTQGDWQQFQERLARDGLDLDKARHLLTPSCHKHTPLPAWTITIQEAVQFIETVPDIVDEKHQWLFLDAARPLPFEELLAPFVALAQQRFLAQAGALTEQLASTVHLTLQRFLLQALTSLALPTLSAELTRIHAQSQSQEPGRESTEQADEESVYRRMLQLLSQGGLATLFLTHSVLARLLAVTCDLWGQAIVELVQRLAVDRPVLIERFHAGKDPGQVTAIEPALSDAHCGRRTVMGLTFASGSRLLYKPRSLGMEEAYYHLLGWCNDQGATPPLQIVTVLNRSTYGWMQYIAQQACQDGEALQRYYQRAGMILCLVYLLGGVDCFYDQFIAQSEQPILVDATHLLHPYLSPAPQQRPGENWEQALYSVLHSGLLASWRLPQTGVQGQASEVSGMDLSQAYNGSPLDTGQPSPSSPALLLKYGSFRPRHPLHVAMLVSGSEHPGEPALQQKFSQGFAQMYRLLLRQRATLLGSAGPLQMFSTQVARVPYRDHAVYAALLPRLLQAEVLHDAVARSLLLEPAGQDCVPLEWYRAGRRDPEHWWTVFAAEREALLQGDIPVVWAHVARNTLVLDKRQEAVSCLYQPAFDLMRARLNHLSNEELKQQLALLQGVLSQQSKLEVTSREGVEDRLGGDLFLARALAIADDIVRDAVHSESASLIWVNVAFAGRRGYYQLRPMRYGFSDGISGIAFFLATLAQQTGIASYGTVASAALRPLTRLLREEGEQLAHEMGLGAGPGLGSVIYALTHCSRVLDDAEMLAAAHMAARLITAERIAAYHLPDVFMGVAGALLGLVTLYETSPIQGVLDRAVACGEHLLRIRTPGSTQARSWQTIGRAQTSGFAHGAAGIIYALTRLYAVTGESALLDAAHEGMLSENLALDQRAGNWAERAGDEKPASGSSWCHGAPGIGLARLGTLATLNTPSVRRDLEIALQTTQQLGSGGLDHLCCGTCGRAELLLVAAQRLVRPELSTQAAHWIEHISARAARRGGFLLDPALPRWIPHPELFQGVAGIGYTLLRLARPDMLPSILLWESSHQR